MGLVVLMKMSVLINFPLQISSLCQSLAKSAKILLVMSDRTDKTPQEPRGIEMGQRASRFEGASVGCAGCINSQPTCPADET